MADYVKTRTQTRRGRFITTRKDSGREDFEDSRSLKVRKVQAKRESNALVCEKGYDFAHRTVRITGRGRRGGMREQEGRGESVLACNRGACATLSLSLPKRSREEKTSCV